MTSTIDQATLTLDGLAIIGELVKVEPVTNRAGDVIDTLARATVKSSRGTTVVTLSAYSRELTGDVPLPAFDKLRVGVGRRWLITVGAATAGAESKYVNYTAIDATEL